MSRRLIPIIFISFLLCVIAACQHDEWDEVPSPVQTFISQYFPFGEVSSVVFGKSGNVTVSIDNGATLSFDKDYNWTDINGNGIPLPGNFLYDQLPQSLYSYLLESEQTAGVYSASRNYDYIVLDLLDTSISYDRTTGDITYPSAL